MTRTPILALSALSLLALIGTAAAQPKLETGPKKFTMAPEYRAIQLSALQSQRKLMLSFADSMPEKLYRDKATPIQRSFSEQIDHIVGAASFISARFITGAQPTPPDSAKVLNSRADLKQYINAQYDLMEKGLKEQSDADRDSQVKFFGTMMPKWQVWDEINQHAMWTAGQVVANFRKQGMAPPAFLFF